MLSIVYTDVTV